MRAIFVICVLFGIVTGKVLADSDSWSEDSKEKESEEDDKIKPLNFLEDSIKGFGDFFKSAGGEVKERQEDGMETLKEFSSQAKEKSEEGLGAMKGFAEGLGERYSNAKEKLEEHGEKMKDALGKAVEKSKDEFETAASQISKHAKDATDLMSSLFGR